MAPKVSGQAQDLHGGCFHILVSYSRSERSPADKEFLVQLRQILTIAYLD